MRNSAYDSYFSLRPIKISLDISLPLKIQFTKSDKPLKYQSEKKKHSYKFN